MACAMLYNPHVQKEAPDSKVRSLQKAKASPPGGGPGQTGKNTLFVTG